MLKFTRSLFAASRAKSRRRRSTGRRWLGATEALETRTLLAADLGTGAPDVSGDGEIEHHSPLVSEGEGEIVGLMLQFTDTSGNVITSVGANEDFQVRIFTEDLRTISESDAGVISAYMNMLFDTSLVSFVGPIAFSDDYDFLNSGGTVSNGQIADINASANFVDFINGNSLGFGEILFATAPFRSNAATSLSAVANDDMLAAFNGSNSLDVLSNDGLGGSALFLLDQSFAVGAEINLFSDSGGTQQADLDPAAGEVLYDQQSLDVVGTGSLTITAVGATSNGGTATIASDGLSIDYTPASGFTGTETFTYTVSSGGSSSTATASVNVTEAAPDLVAFAQALSAENIQFYGAIWCPFCAQQKELFEDGADHLPFIEVTNPDRSLNQIGIDNNISSFPTWVFQDGTRREGVLSLEEISTLSGIAIPTGIDPFLAEIEDSTVLDGAPLHVALNGYDPNGGPLTYTVEISNPSVVEATVLTGNRSMLIDMAGYEDMLFQLFDGRMQDVTDVIASLAQNGTYDDVIFHRVINDFVIQGGDPTGTGFGDPSLATFDDQFDFDLQHVQTGLLSMAKSGDDTNSSQFFVTEGTSRHLDFNHSVFGLLVEGESARQGISNTAVNASDQPINTVRMNTVTIFEDTENGVMMLKAIDGATGTSDVTVTVTDGEGNTFQRTFTVTIQPDASNGGPFLSDIPTDITTTVNTPVEIQLEGNDVEGDPVVFSAIATGTVTGTTVDVNSTTGVVTVTPPTGFVGTLQVLMRVEADPSVGDDTTDRFDSQVVDITVLDIPAPSGIDLLNTSDTGVSDTDNNTNASSLEFEVSGVTAGNTVQLFLDGTLIGDGIAAADTIVITADLDSSVADGTLAFTATQIAGGLASSASTPLAIALDRTAPGDFTSTPPTDIASGSLLTYNIEHPEEGSLTYTLVTQGVTGLAVDSATGVLTWTPTTAQEGPQTIVVTASDDAGNSIDHTINLTVSDPAIPALTDEYSVDEDNTLNVSAAAGVLANDNNGTTTGLAAALGTDVSNGSLTLNADGSFSYTPDADFSGTDTFTYTFNDSTNTSNEALVVITVNNVNDPPIGTDDSYTVVEDGTLTIDAAAGVLDNDVDQEGGVMTASVLQDVANGTLTLNADGSFSYSPDANFAGTDTFTYTVTDDGAATDTATVTITVTAVNDPPVAVDDSYTVSEDGTLTIDAANGVLANDTDVENDALNAFIINNAANGTVTLNGDGSFTYTPNADFFGTDTFTYRANDNTINSGNIGTVTITVESEADPPTAVNDTATVFRGATAERIDVLANDTTDPDGTQTMTVTAVGTGSQSGTLTIIESGAAVAYTPATDFSGTETFTYTITDADGLTDTATITITVEEFAPSSLGGFVYIDANDNGVFDSGEVPVGGVTITLAGTDSNSETVNRTVTTGADGSYEFADIVPGDYTITQTQPLFLIDGQTTVGSQGGTSASNVITITLAEDVTGTGNNFGEMGRESTTATMFDWFSSTPTDGIFSATDTAGGQLWYYVESGWEGDPTVDFELEDALDTGTLSVAYGTEAAQTSTLSNGTERDYSIYATQGTSHFTRIHGSASSLGLTSTAAASNSSGEGEGESSSTGTSEGEGEAPAAITHGLTSEGESGDFVIDVLPTSSLTSEGESEAETTAVDDNGSAVDQAMLDLDSRTIAEQASDNAVDAAANAVTDDNSEDDDELEALLDVLTAE